MWDFWNGERDGGRPSIGDRSTYGVSGTEKKGGQRRRGSSAMAAVVYKRRLPAVLEYILVVAL